MGTQGREHRDAMAAEVLDAMPERVTRFRFADRVVQYCNLAWAAGHGLTPTEAIGRRLDDLLTPPELIGMWAQLARLGPQMPVLADPEPRTAPEDPGVWVEWVDRLVDGPDGPEILSVGRDVTARHDAEMRLWSSEERFRLAMASAPIGMELVGLDGRLLEVNEAFCRFLGRSEAELRQAPGQQFTHPDDRTVDEDLVQRLFAGEFPSYTIEKRYLHADGSIRCGLLAAAVVRPGDGRPPYSIGQVVDITARKRAEGVAERSASLLRVAGSVARLGGWAWELGSGEVTWSDTVCEILGYPIGTRPTFEEVMTLYLPPEREQLDAAIAACLANGTPWDMEHAMLTRTAEVLWIRSVGHAERDTDGSVTRIWGAFQDITERRRDQQEVRWLAEQLSATLESVDDGVLTVDETFEITYANRRVAQMADRQVEELVGQNLWDAFPALRETAAYDAYQEALTSGLPASIERYHDERLALWLDVEAYPSARGGLAVYFRDVSHHLEREHALERTVAAERLAAEQLRELDRAKNAFLSAVSHELRTPLTVVYGMATSLQRLRGGLDEAMRATMEDAVVTHASQLRELLDDLLDLDRMARGQLHAARTPVDVVEAFREVLAGTSVHDRIRLEAPTALMMHADAVQLERIVLNLLDNAAKYAPEGPVVVRLLARPGGDGLRLEVEDRGPGVPPEEYQRIFEPFHRIDDRHPQPGTGVGLALVADFARIHGGRAWVEPAESGGARFVVEIPDGAASRPHIADLPPPEAQ